MDKENKKNELNNRRNKPILMLTYFFAALFLCMMIYIVQIIVVEKDSIIANPYNKRADAYEDYVTRGEIITSDGVVVATNNAKTRYYPYGNMFSHVVGFSTYGKSGLELDANYYLLTSNADVFERVDNMVNKDKNIGDNVITTLDYHMQEAASNALGDTSGAVIVMEPDTGKILAMVSKPDFDPNDIDNVWESVTAEDSTGSSILLNRSTQGLYPPGSTFKVLTLLEYMREHKDYEDYSYDCLGENIFNSVTIHCASSKVHGEEDLKDSFAHSCNTSFANIGISLDIKAYHDLCNSFLYNGELPYDGVYNQSKFVLTQKSDKSLIPQTAIGQGDTVVTPLHNALIMSTIANGGIMMKPYLIDSIENHNGALIKKFTSESYKKIITPSEAEDLTEYLCAVTEYGTAAKKFEGITYTVAGKTGTAEYNSEGKAHSWFIGFSNVENPDIVVSVVIEDASSTDKTGTSVAREIFDAYYE